MKINNEVDEYESQRVGENCTDDERIIARVNRRNQQAACSRPGEDRLDDDRAGQQRASSKPTTVRMGMNAFLNRAATGPAVLLAM